MNENKLKSVLMRLIENQKRIVNWLEDHEHTSDGQAHYTNDFVENWADYKYKELHDCDVMDIFEVDKNGKM